MSSDIPTIAELMDLIQKGAEQMRKQTGYAPPLYLSPAAYWATCSDGGPHEYPPGVWCSIIPPTCQRCGRRAR